MYVHYVNFEIDIICFIFCGKQKTPCRHFATEIEREGATRQQIFSQKAILYSQNMEQLYSSFLDWRFDNRIQVNSVLG